MNENLEKRKSELLASLNSEYFKQHKQWWQFPHSEYETTQQAACRSRHSGFTEDDIIIQYDLERALKGSALFLFVTVGMFMVIQENGKMWDSIFLFWMLLIILFTIVPLLKEIKRAPKIILSQQSIWLHLLQEPIPWQNLVATYLKKVVDSDSETIYLVLHYYIEKYDAFAVTEYKLHNLTLSAEDLAAAIEYRQLLKQQWGNKIPPFSFSSRQG